MGTRVILLGWHFKNDLSFKKGDKTFNWNSDQIKKIKNINFIIGSFNCNPIVFDKEEHKYKIYLFAHPKGEISNNWVIDEDIKDVIVEEKDNEILIYLHENPWYANQDFKAFQGTNRDKIVLHIKSGGGVHLSMVTREF